MANDLDPYYNPYESEGDSDDCETSLELDSDTKRSRTVFDLDNDSYPSSENISKHTRLVQKSVDENSLKSVKTRNQRCLIRRGGILYIYQCNFCFYQTPFRFRLKTHFLRCKKTGSRQYYKCPECSVEYTSEQLLEKHSIPADRENIDKHTVFFCTTCSSHQDTDSKVAILEKIPPYTPISFICPCCKIRIMGIHVFKKHVSTEHNFIVKYKCEYCKYSSLESESLQKHQKSHSDLQEMGLIRCSHCQLDFFTISDFKEHTRRIKWYEGAKERGQIVKKDKNNMEEEKDESKIEKQFESFIASESNEVNVDSVDDKGLRTTSEIKICHLQCSLCEYKHYSKASCYRHVKNKHRRQGFSLVTFFKYLGGQLKGSLDIGKIKDGKDDQQKAFKKLNILDWTRSDEDDIPEQNVLDKVINNEVIIAVASDCANESEKNEGKKLSGLQEKKENKDSDNEKDATSFSAKKRNTFTCNECEYLTKYKVHLSIHIQLNHKTLGVFRCPKLGCSYKSTFRQNLRRHLVKCHKYKLDLFHPQELKCQDCLYTTSKYHNLMVHRSRAHNPRIKSNKTKGGKSINVTYHCKHCPDFRTIYYRSYYRHLKNKHSEHPSLARAHLTNGKFTNNPPTCKQCEQNYKGSYDHAWHRFVCHSDEFELKKWLLKCKICGYVNYSKLTCHTHGLEHKTTYIKFQKFYKGQLKGTMDFRYLYHQFAKNYNVSVLKSKFQQNFVETEKVFVKQEDEKTSKNEEETEKVFVKQEDEETSKTEEDGNNDQNTATKEPHKILDWTQSPEENEDNLEDQNILQEKNENEDSGNGEQTTLSSVNKKYAFECSECQYRTEDEVHLLIHKELNHKILKEKEKVFQCPQPDCTYNSKLRISLRTHLKKYHKYDLDIFCPESFKCHENGLSIESNKITHNFVKSETVYIKQEEEETSNDEEDPLGKNTSAGYEYSMETFPKISKPKLKNWSSSLPRTCPEPLAITSNLDLKDEDTTRLHDPSYTNSGSIKVLDWTQSDNENNVGEIGKNVPLEIKEECIETIDDCILLNVKDELFTCSQCNYETKNESHLPLHQLLVHGEPIRSEDAKYKCKDCAFESRYRHNLKRHLMNTHKYNVEEYYLYNTDDGKSKTQINERDVTSESNSERLNATRSKNVIPSDTSTENRSLFFFYNSGSKDTKYRCPDCEFESQYRHNFKKHLINIHKYNTEECNIMFDGKNQIQNENTNETQSKNATLADTATKNMYLFSLYNSGSKSKKYKCPDCKFESEHRQNFRRHLIDIHYYDPEVYTTDYGENKTQSRNEGDITSEFKSKSGNISQSKNNRIEGMTELEKLLCSQKYKDKYLRDWHMFSAHGDNTKMLNWRIQCSLCSYETYLQKEACKHAFEEHSSATESTVVKFHKYYKQGFEGSFEYVIDKKKLPRCDRCDYVAKTWDCLRRHYYIHKIPNFKCTETRYRINDGGKGNLDLESEVSAGLGKISHLGEENNTEEINSSDEKKQNEFIKIGIAPESEHAANSSKNSSRNDERLKPNAESTEENRCIDHKKSVGDIEIALRTDDETSQSYDSSQNDEFLTQDEEFIEENRRNNRSSGDSSFIYKKSVNKIKVGSEREDKMYKIQLPGNGNDKAVADILYVVNRCILPGCRYYTKDKWLLKRHCLVVHKYNRRKLDDILSQLKQYKCLLCKFESKDLREMRNHKKAEHTGTCLTQYAKTIPVRKHSSFTESTVARFSKSYKNKFNASSNYRCIIRRPYRCNKCEFISHRREALQKHAVRHNKAHFVPRKRVSDRSTEYVKKEDKGAKKEAGSAIDEAQGETGFVEPFTKQQILDISPEIIKKEDCSFINEIQGALDKLEEKNAEENKIISKIQGNKEVLTTEIIPHQGPSRETKKFKKTTDMYTFTSPLIIESGNKDFNVQNSIKLSLEQSKSNTQQALSREDKKSQKATDMNTFTSALIIENGKDSIKLSLEESKSNTQQDLSREAKKCKKTTDMNTLTRAQIIESDNIYLNMQQVKNSIKLSLEESKSNTQQDPSREDKKWKKTTDMNTFTDPLSIESDYKELNLEEIENSINSSLEREETTDLIKSCSKNNFQKSGIRTKFACHLCEDVFTNRNLLKSHCNAHAVAQNNPYLLVGFSVVLNNRYMHDIEIEADLDVDQEISVNKSGEGTAEIKPIKIFYECCICGDEVTRQTLRKHTNIHAREHGNLKLKVKYLKFRYNSMESMIIMGGDPNCEFRLKNKRREKSPELDYNFSQPVFGCDECNFKSNEEEALKKHKNLHWTALKDPSCVFRLKSKRQEKSPALDHNLKQPVFSCDECKFKSNKEEALKKHKNLHWTAEKGPSCTFRLKSKRQEKGPKFDYNLSQPVFSCDECNFKSNKEETLKKHKNLHWTAEKDAMFKAQKWFDCSACVFYCFDVETFTKHVEWHKTKRKTHCIFTENIKS